MDQSSATGKINGVTVLADPEDISPYIGGDKKTIILFEMTGCPFCRIFQAKFLDFTEERSIDCTFLRVMLDDHQNPLWRKYEIKAVPTVIAFSGGKISSRADATPMLGISKKKWAAFRAGLK